MHLHCSGTGILVLDISKVGNPILIEINQAPNPICLLGERTPSFKDPVLVTTCLARNMNLCLPRAGIRILDEHQVRCAWSRIWCQLPEPVCLGQESRAGVEDKYVIVRARGDMDFDGIGACVARFDVHQIEVSIVVVIVEFPSAVVLLRKYRASFLDSGFVAGSTRCNVDLDCFGTCVRRFDEC